MSHRRGSKKLKVQLSPPEDMKEHWDSQAEEEMEDWDSQAEEVDSLEEDSLEEEDEEAEEVEEATAAKQLSSAAETSKSPDSSTATISAPGRGAQRRPNSRWDETGRFPNPTTASKTGKKERQGYKSWRGHKNAIISCLHECGGNISFTRRYLLFHHAPTAVSKSRQPRQKKTAATTVTRKPAVRKSTTSAAGGGLRITANEPAQTRELRNRIFPTLYAIFQQSRGQEQELKVKNRSLRSLTRSCLYHKSEDQLQRTLEDAEALFNKYCALTLKE
ncbi:L4 33 kDa protein [Human adenovirus 7]|uniref:33 kDa protein n=1 Tax=Human adenovirus B serotype 7 TaxID=10519 RepID=Q5EY58_ADE07|nr:L4 33 kDa protein [Human adenovirus 7]ACX32411.1 L4 33 kDa protein [Human adenovirus 7]AEC11873.1 33 kDa protein [Human adenovirus 7]